MEIPILTGGIGRKRVVDRSRDPGYKADEFDTAVYKTDTPVVKGCSTDQEDQLLHTKQWIVE